MFPDRDWTWMRGVIRNLAYLAKPVRDKRAKIVSARELLDYGFELLARAEGEDGGSALDRALLYRDGLMIAMLAARPFRESNFAPIVIGQHLVKRGAAYWLCFEGSETKNHRPIELPVPEIFNQHIQRYCDHYRPVLFPRNRGWVDGNQETGATCDALWLSSRGNPMSANTLYACISTRTRTKFGFAITPHLFRDCAATSIAIDDPAHVRIAAKLLGHAQFKTTERSYIQARSFEASRRHQNAIETYRMTDAAYQPMAENKEALSEKRSTVEEGAKALACIEK